MTEEEKRKVCEIIKHSQDLRGKFIDAFIVIETNIDSFITNYFVKETEKRTQFLTQVLDSRRVEFEKKLNIYKDILCKNQEPEIKKTFSDLHNHIIDLMNDRNIFAHSKIDTGKDGLDAIKKEGLVFIKYNRAKGIPEGVLYSKIKLGEIQTILNHCIKLTTEVALATS